MPFPAIRRKSSWVVPATRELSLAGDPPMWASSVAGLLYPKRGGVSSRTFISGQGNRLQIVCCKKSQVCRGGYHPPALSNVMQAMKMLIAAIRFFRADDIRPYNDRNSFSVCSCFCRKIAISDFPVYQGTFQCLIEKNKKYASFCSDIWKKVYCYAIIILFKICKHVSTYFEVIA